MLKAIYRSKSVVCEAAMKNIWNFEMGLFDTVQG